MAGAGNQERMLSVHTQVEDNQVVVVGLALIGEDSHQHVEGGTLPWAEDALGRLVQVGTTSVESSQAYAEGGVKVERSNLEVAVALCFALLGRVVVVQPCFKEKNEI